jgi:hypothetical protein
MQCGGRGTLGVVGVGRMAQGCCGSQGQTCGYDILVRGCAVLEGGVKRWDILYIAASTYPGHPFGRGVVVVWSWE